MYIYVCKHTHTHIYICILLHKYIIYRTSPVIVSRTCIHTYTYTRINKCDMPHSSFGASLFALMHTHTHTHIQTRRRTDRHTHPHKHTHTYTRQSSRFLRHELSFHALPHGHTLTHAHTHIHANACIHVHIRTDVHAYMCT